MMPTWLEILMMEITQINALSTTKAEYVVLNKTRRWFGYNIHGRIKSKVHEKCVAFDN